MASISALGVSIAALAIPILAIVGVVAIFAAALAAVVLAIQAIVVFTKNIITGNTSTPTEDEYWSEEIWEILKRGATSIARDWFGAKDVYTKKEREEMAISQAQVNEIASKLTEELDNEVKFSNLRRRLRAAQNKKDYDLQVKYLREQGKLSSEQLKKLIKSYNEGNKKLRGGGLTIDEFKNLQTELKGKLQQIERLDQQRYEAAQKEKEIWAMLFIKETEFLEKRAEFRNRLRNFSNSYNYGYLKEDTPWGKKGQFGNWIKQAQIDNSAKSLAELRERIEALRPASISATDKTGEIFDKLEGNKKAISKQEAWYKGEEAKFKAGKISKQMFDEITNDYNETMKILKEVRTGFIHDLVTADAEFLKQNPEVLARVKKYAEMEEKNYLKTREDYGLRIEKLAAQREKLIAQQNALTELTRQASEYRQSSVDAVEARSMEAYRLQSRELSSSQSFIAPMVEQQKEIKKVDDQIMKLQAEAKKELEKITDNLKLINQRLTLAEGGRIDRIEFIEPRIDD